MRRSLSLLAVATVLATVASCDSPSGPKPAGAPAHLDVVSGDRQTAPVGTQLPAPLVVKATDDAGSPIQGQLVHFTVAAGNGTVLAGTSVTDANGLAAERWTLGTVARDTQAVDARILESSTAATLVLTTFHAVGTPGAPAALAKVKGDAQSGPAGAALADSLAVRLADRFGNGVAGQPVSFAVVSGGGSVAPTGATTDSGGVARAQWKLGARLDTAQAATATFGALPAVSFAATATVSGNLAKLSGDGQTGPVAHLLADSLAVRLTLADGSPVKGATIQWTTATGSVLPATSVTDATGTARAAWLLGTASGPQGATATVVGGSQSVAFAATGTSDGPSRLTVVGSSTRSGAAGQPIADSLAVQLKDAYGNPTPGAPVTWTVTNGGTLSPATSTTDAAGIARTQWSPGPVVGVAQQASATAGALGPVAFSANVTLPASAVLEVAAGDNQTAPVGARLPDTVKVRVRLADGRPVKGQGVTVDVQHDSTGVTGPHAYLSSFGGPTDSLGLVRVTWTLGAFAEPKTLRAFVDSARSVLVHATGTPRAPAAFVTRTGEITGQARQPLADSLFVVVGDTFFNPLANQTVQWSAAAGNGTLSPTTTTTRADGSTRAQWTLGSNAGTEAATATVVGAPRPVSTTFIATVAGGISIAASVSLNTRGDTATGTATIRTASALVSVTADIDGHPVPIALVSGSMWRGTWDISTLPHGTAHWTVTAIDDAGDTASVVTTFYKNSAPAVALTAPIENGVYSDMVHVSATCTDDDPAGCARLRVEGVLGTSSVDFDFSLVPYAQGQRALISATGTDSDGLQATATHAIYVVTNPHLARVADVPAPAVMWDISADRLLSSDTSSGQNVVRLHDRATGASSVIGTTGKYQYRQAFVASNGAVLANPPFKGGLGRVLDLTGGRNVLDLLSDSVKVHAGTAAWIDDYGLVALNLATGVRTQLAPPAFNNVTQAGDVIYVQGGRVKVYRMATGTTDDLGATVGTPRMPVLDGTDVVYGTQITTPSGDRLAMMRNADTLAVFSLGATLKYDADDGWVAYTAPGLSSQSEVWRISPAGVAEKLTSSSSDSYLELLGPSGMVVYTSNGQRYLAVPGSAPVSLGGAIGTTVTRVGSTMYVLIGTAAFQINP